jgi:hypothetical protein
MKFRYHRLSLAEAMTTVVDIEPTLEALATELNTNPKRLRVDARGFDSRVEWDTHAVTLDGQIVGFTDGPIQSESGSSGHDN